MMGPQEYYRLRKRDYKHSPRTEAEKAQAGIWQEVCREASAIVKHPEHPRYAELRERWNAQFDGGCDAFLNEGQTEKVVYGMFPVFVRMVLLKEKKNSPRESTLLIKKQSPKHAPSEYYPHEKIKKRMAYACICHFFVVPLQPISQVHI